MAFFKLIARYLAALGIIIAAAVVLHLVAQPGGIHLDKAELALESTVGYQPPPATLDLEAMPGPWMPVALPNAAMPKLALSQQGSGGGAAVAAGPVDPVDDVQVVGDNHRLSHGRTSPPHARTGRSPPPGPARPSRPRAASSSAS